MPGSRPAAGAARAADATTPALCAAHTRSGSPCRRRAAKGSRYCSQHAASAGATANGATADRQAKPAPKRSARTKQQNGLPADIDTSALEDVIDDLGRGGFLGSSAAHAQSMFDDIASVAGWVTGNLGRIRDAALALGVPVDPRKLEHFVVDLTRALAALTAGVAARVSGNYEEDDFGFDEAFTESFVPLMALLYDYYWRVEVTGIENIPAEGRGLLVSNHAGAGLPFDGAMIKLACFREAPEPRHLRMLVLDWLMGLPWLADLMRTTGQVLACSPNALELLQRDELVAVFPEGVKGMAKNFSQRYNLERFGRGGFVRIALKTGAPIIPVAVVGSEEIYPKIGNLPIVNKLVGAPFVPMTPLFPLLGPLGLIPLPSKWHIEFCDPIDVSQYPPEAADDRSFVLELSERIRATIQERLRANLLKRSTPFW